MQRARAPTDAIERASFDERQSVAGGTQTVEHVLQPDVGGDQRIVGARRRRAGRATSSRRRGAPGCSPRPPGRWTGRTRRGSGHRRCCPAASHSAAAVADATASPFEMAGHSSGASRLTRRTPNPTTQTAAVAKSRVGASRPDQRGQREGHRQSFDDAAHGRPARGASCRRDRPSRRRDPPVGRPRS